MQVKDLALSKFMSHRDADQTLVRFVQPAELSSLIKMFVLQMMSLNCRLYSSRRVKPLVPADLFAIHSRYFNVNIRG